MPTATHMRHLITLRIPTMRPMRTLTSALASVITAIRTIGATTEDTATVAVTATTVAIVAATAIAAVMVTDTAATLEAVAATHLELAALPEEAGADDANDFIFDDCRLTTDNGRDHAPGLSPLHPYPKHASIK